jgi:phosphatidylserine/phosphatidylglycerophosphate/cardiolipin synthase-like enzyme
MGMRTSILLLTLAACRPTSTEAAPVTVTATATATATVTAAATAPGPAIRSFFVTPSDSGLQPVVDAIAGARKSIRMTMFHLTQPDVENALVAAKARGVDVRILLDGRLLEKPASGEIAQRLVDHGITVTKSSPAFSITHVKAMVVDDARAMILSLNLTRPYDHTRDYGIVTDDRGVVDEVIRVFEADVENAASGTSKTPPLADDALVWSPVDAEARLVRLVDSAQKTIAASTENLGDKAMQEAFARAAGRGVAVRLLVPLCDENSEPLRNVKWVAELDRKNVDARVMPPPATHEQPYEHGKMIVVDGARMFIGSINFSENSMKRARELGIVFEDPAAIRTFSTAFDADWRFAAPPPDEKSASRDLCR